MLLVPFTALVTALLVSPAMARLATRIGFVDRPDGRLKVHAAAVPYGGGVAVALALFAALLLDPGIPGSFAGWLPASIVLGIGLIDDSRPLGWMPKLAVQGAAALLAVGSGLVFSLPFAGETWSTAATVLWLVAVTNAVNFIDVSDGLCGGVTAVAASAMGVLAVAAGERAPAMTCFALAAALAGFLCWNAPPARIYLGDAGAYFAGFVLAAQAVELQRLDRLPGAELAGAALILAVPLLDLLAVSALRCVRGESPLRGSPDHLAVRLRRAGWSPRRITTAGALAAMLTSTAGIAVGLGSGPYVAFGATAVVGVLLVTGATLLRRRSASSSIAATRAS